MKYLCMIYYAKSELEEFNAMPASERERAFAAVFELGNDLKRRGKLVSSAPLEPGSASTVTKRNGTLSVTDGPFIETKEQLTGYYLIEARDLNEAIQLAGELAEVSYGIIEVRPVNDPPRDGATA